MVTESAVSQQVDLELRSLELMLSDLAEVAVEWESLGAGERAGWSHDWDQVVGSIDALLQPRHVAGKMRADQDRRYRSSVAALHAALPILRRLNLSSPSALEVV